MQTFEHDEYMLSGKKHIANFLFLCNARGNIFHQHHNAIFTNDRSVSLAVIKYKVKEFNSKTFSGHI